MAAASLGLPSRLGHYRTTGKIGEGGMGEVYRACDEHLDREVALKVLHPGVLADESMRKRFRKEALALSKFTHPNIATVFDFDTQEGIDFLVTEYILGRSLDSMIAGGRLREKEIVRLGIQLAEALEAAHREGVIHRDLKPANILVTPEGRLKVLDFGLARMVRPCGPSAPTASETLTPVFAGTLPYMAPEQLQGGAGDARTDVYAAGVVLYEMATGHLPFPADALAAMLVDILQRSPAPPGRLNSELSPRLEDIILKCLEKDPENRYQSAKELLVDLRRLAAPPELAPAQAPQAGSPRPWLLASAVLAAAALLAGLLAAFLLREQKAITTPPPPWVQVTDFTDSATSPALSPDGRMLAFVRGPNTFFGPGQIYVKLLPDGQPVQLTHTEQWKMDPVFTPDGSRIAYTVPWDSWIVQALGGEPRLLLPNASGLRWIGDDQLLFSEIDRGIHMGVVTASASRALERSVYWPTHQRGMAHRSYLSPDRQWVLLAEMDNRGWLPCRLVPFDGSSAGRKVGPPDAACTAGAWSPDGKWMYVSAETGGTFHIWRQEFPQGAPRQITAGATNEEGIAISTDGKWLFSSVGMAQASVWVHDGEGEHQVSSEGYAGTTTFSPDGKKLFYIRRSQPRAMGSFFVGELWVVDLDSGVSDALLPGFAVTGYSLSRDGRQIAFAALEASGKRRIWVMPADRHAPPQQLSSEVNEDEPVFGRDGELFFRAEEGADNYVYRLGSDGTRKKVVPDLVVDLNDVSPDGRWILVSLGMEGARWRFSVRAYPSAGGMPVLVAQGIRAAGWSADGKWFYVLAAGKEDPITVALPVSPATMLPTLPAGGIQSSEDLAKVPGSKVFEHAIAPGPDASVYAYVVRSVHRNIFRIPLP